MEATMAALRLATRHLEQLLHLPYPTIHFPCPIRDGQSNRAKKTQL